MKEQIHQQTSKNDYPQKQRRKQPYVNAKYILQCPNGVSSASSVSKRQIFTEIINIETGKNTLESLIHMFDKNLFNSTYPLVTNHSYLKLLSFKLRSRYTKVNCKTADGKTIYIFNEWRSYIDRAKQLPGNFILLQELASSLGYKIIEAELQNLK